MRGRAATTAVMLLLSGVLCAQEPVHTTEYDVPPRLLKQKKPKYPADAFRSRLEGTVLVEFVVDEKGRVEKARVKESVPGLDNAAIEAVLKWKFKPAQKNGSPVRTFAQAPVTFCIMDCGELRLRQQTR